MIQKPKNSERHYECPRFAVDEVTFETRNGLEASKPMVTHGGSVLILPVMEDAKVVMIRNYRFSVDERLWELPAGTLDGDEAPLACAKREIIEETGYEANKWEALHSFYPAPGMTNERMHAFIARDLKHVGQALEDTEDIEVVVMGHEEVMGLIREREIIDGKTIAMLLYYDAYVRNGKRCD